MQSSIDLTLPSLPEIEDSVLFKEFVIVYNAIKTLAQGLDDYTLEGDIVNQVQEAQMSAEVAKAIFIRGIKSITQELESAPQFQAAFFELRKQYYRYTVPKFTVKTSLSVGTQFSLGDPTVVPPAGVQIITKHSSNSPAGGVGTAAGAFADAATRDQAIAAINANAAAITELQTFLKTFGLIKEP